MESALMAEPTALKIEYIVLIGGWLYKDEYYEHLKLREREMIHRYMENWASTTTTNPEQGVQPEFIRVDKKWVGYILVVHMKSSSLADIIDVSSQNGEKIEYTLEYPQKSSELPSGLGGSSQPWREPGFSVRKAP